MSVAERTVRFTAEGVLTLDGQTVQLPEGVTDPYEYCLNILIHQAYGSGTPVSVQAIDDPTGESTFFTVMPNGEVRTHQQPAHNQQAQQGQHQQTQRPAQHSAAPQQSAPARAPQEPAHDADREPSAPPAPPQFEPAQPEAEQHSSEQDRAEQQAAEQFEPQVVEHASAEADSEEEFSAEAALPTTSDQPAGAEDAAEPAAPESAQSTEQDASQDADQGADQGTDPVASQAPAQQPAEQETAASEPSQAADPAPDTDPTSAAGHTPEADQDSASEHIHAAGQPQAEHQDSSAETPLPEELQRTQPQEGPGEQAPAAPSPAEPAPAEPASAESAPAAEQDPGMQFTDQVTQQTELTEPGSSDSAPADQDPHRAAEPQRPASGPDLETSPTPEAPAPEQHTPAPELHNPAPESTYPTPAQNLPPADFTFPAADEPLPVQPVAGPPLDAYGQEPELDMEPSRRERRLRAEQENFLEREREPGPGTWAKTVEVLTLGLNKAGPSAEEREQQARAQRIRRRLTGSHNTAVLSLKGGIGKTSTTVGVGHALAEHRGDMVCAVDANPDSGDLVERALGEAELHSRTGLTISDVVNDVEKINSLTGLQNYLEISDRLYVLAGEQDPELSDSLTAQEYRRVHDLLSQYFAVTLTDCGTGVSHPAMEAVLERADNIVIAAGYAISGAERARRVLTWLDDQGYSHLADEAIIVITDKDTVSDRVIPEKINEILAGLCRGLYVVPHDPAVADGDSVRLDQLKPATLKAYREIAAAIVDGYPSRDGERHGA